MRPLALSVLLLLSCDQAAKVQDAAKQARKSAEDAATRTTAAIDDGSEDIHKVLAKGAQVAPVALDVAKTVNAAVDSDTEIDPIYQSLEGRDPVAVDKAISSMSRVEVIDGLKVGFSQLSSTDARVQVDETAYLITWRSEDHLIGLVYRTKRTIDIEMLIKETPRLVAMTKAAIAEP